MKISKSTKKKLFYEMARIRMIEKNIASKYSEWEMRCPVHLSIGQEAIAVGICQNLKKNDKIVTAHRSHAHYLAKGGSLKKMLAELYGKETGCAKRLWRINALNRSECGRYCSSSNSWKYYTNRNRSCMGKQDKKREIVVAFFGDGATEEGVFFESLDFASLHRLPILYVCENNEYSVYSHISKKTI